MFRKFFAGLRSRPALFGVFVAVAFAVFLLCLISSTIITFILPEAYSSRARIKLERDVIAAPGAPGQTAAKATYDPYFIQTEFEVIQSEKTLDRVVDALDLNVAWAKKFGLPANLKYSESRALLKSMIELRPARNTSLIDITVYSGDKLEAARIANAVADAYLAYRWELREKLRAGSADRYKQLKDQLKSELADKTNDPKVVDAKITETIARAGQVYQNMNAGVSSGSVEIIERAQPGFRPVRPNKPLNIFLGGAVGAILGLVIGGATVGVIAGTSPRQTAAIA